MNFITYNQLCDDVVRNIHRIPHDVDLIVGVPRSGLLLADIIALYMNKPITDIDGLLSGNYFDSGTTKSKIGWPKSFEDVSSILVVEDSVCTGLSIGKVKERIANKLPDVHVYYIAAYVTPNNIESVDLFFREIEYPRLFEWNFLHQKSIMEKACFDIDGVLCVDPSPSQNDDGDEYVKFILNAPEKLIPSCKIGYIVTSRLEKYRTYTEAWLAKQGIIYDELIMLDGITAEQRRKLNSHAEFKSTVYKQLKDSTIFIESDDTQAKKIRELTGKDVFCINSRQFYRGSIINDFLVNPRRTIKHSLKAILPRFILDGYKKFRM